MDPYDSKGPEALLILMLSVLLIGGIVLWSLNK